MGILISLLVSTATVLIAAYVVPGVHVDSFFTALVVGVVLAVINTFLKPVLVILTLPVTILTLGLFLLIINAAMIMLAAAIVPGFSVSNWVAALLFSLALSVVGWVLQSLFKA